MMGVLFPASSRTCATTAGPIARCREMARLFLQQTTGDTRTEEEKFLGRTWCRDGVLDWLRRDRPGHLGVAGAGVRGRSDARAPHHPVDDAGARLHQR